MDGVYEYENSARVGLLDNLGDLGPPAGGVPDPAEREQSSPVVDGLQQTPNVQLSGRHGNTPRLDLAAAQVQPGIDIGREFVAGDDDIVTCPPRQALRDQPDTAAGIRNKGDFIRVSANQLGSTATDRFDPATPIRPHRITLVRRLSGPLLDGVASGTRQWADRRIIEVSPLLRLRESSLEIFATTAVMSFMPSRV